MTKTELIETVARATRQPKKMVAQTIELTFEHITRAISAETNVFWVRDLAHSQVRRWHKARAGFNPRTNSAMIIPATRTVEVFVQPRS